MAKTRRVDGQDKCQGGYGHSWYDYDFDVLPPAHIQWWTTFQCERCDRRRVFGYDGALKTIYRRYIDPPGWRKGNLADRAEVRKRALKVKTAKKSTRRLKAVS